MTAVIAWRQQSLQGCSEQIALEGQDLPRTYLAQHELESVNVFIIDCYYYCYQQTIRRKA